MLLVDDDEAEVPERREYRRAGAHEHRGAPVSHGEVGVKPVPVGEPRVGDGDRDAEAPHEPRERLRCQAYLRNHHEGLSARSHDLLDELQVNLGLPRSGDALEEEHAEALLGRDRAEGGALLPVELLAVRDIDRLPHGPPVRGNAPEIKPLDYPFPEEPLEDGRGNPRLCKLPPRDRRAVTEE